MECNEQRKAYLALVTAQIRWKKMHPIIAKELEAHLFDQEEAFLAQGMEQSSATKEALAQMGDPLKLGHSLDRTHRPKPQWLLLSFIGMFLAMGFGINYLMSISLSPVPTPEVLPYGLAFVVFLCCYFLDFSILGKYPRKLYFLTLVLSSVLIFYGTQVNGGSIWFIGNFPIPLSYVSLIFPLAFALFVYSMRQSGTMGILACGMAYLPFAVLISMIPTLSGLVLYTITAVAILCFAICRHWFGVEKKPGLSLVLLPSVTALLGLMILLPMGMPHILKRASAVLSPEQDLLGAGYVFGTIRNFMASAAFYGSSGDASALTALPMDSDYVLVYLIHQFGFITLLLLGLLLGLFSAMILYKIQKEKSILGGLISYAIVLPFIIQLLIYIIFTLGYGFLAPISLPFLSSGNVILLLNAGFMGILLSVFRTGDSFKDSPWVAAQRRPFFSYKDGTLQIYMKR